MVPSTVQSFTFTSNTVIAPKNGKAVKCLINCGECLLCSVLDLKNTLQNQVRFL